MKLFPLSALLAILIFSSCSKKGTPTPVTTISNPNTGIIVIGGVTYPTIIIGKQTWTSSNYAGPGGVAASTDATYGNYYTLAQANTVTLPTGWRIPTRTDYNNLLANYTTTVSSSGDYIGDLSVTRALADTSSIKWSNLTATNKSGFSAIPGGFYDPVGKILINQFFDGAYLTSTVVTQSSGNLNYFFGINEDGVSLGVSTSYYAGLDYFTNIYGYSLRFVKDNP
jgi:uncharacterized protein (TIGR02145 family)